MKKRFRIHGDNIVECERIANLIISEGKPYICEEHLATPSSISFILIWPMHDLEWQIDLLPGFNKHGRSRWEGDIFESLRRNGSYLDETPDAILTEVNENDEEILCAIEFCSALQAGNQSWQRSGRAFSTSRTGCPYIYIVDFVKYELNPDTRKEKALRFPNPAVPFSYINFSRVTGNFAVQVYVRSESFDKNADELRSFNENDFAEAELQRYIVKRMAHLDTGDEERIMLEKNFNIVKYLSSRNGFSTKTNFTSQDWQEIYDSGMNVIDYCIFHNRFNYHKTVTEKGAHGHIKDLLKIIDQYSVGFTSKDLPIGIIPAKYRPEFANRIQSIYTGFSPKIIDKLANSKTNLVLCLIKGFKPHGDDNRPDRGVLPLSAMLSNNDNETLTVVYGPIFYKNYKLLTQNPRALAVKNGLWKSILCLSNFLITDAPILSASNLKSVENIFDTSEIKMSFNQLTSQKRILESPLFPNTVRELHEDDVDTGIHYLFAHKLKSICFEGLCNPPGGDWSGLSVIDHGIEVRWLSLPRVSERVQGKRPDHVIEIFHPTGVPILLVIESKEKSADLEPNVGIELKNYIKALMNYVPNVERTINPIGSWQRATRMVNINDFIIISAAAYLKGSSEESRAIFNNSKCEMLFSMSSHENGWNIELAEFSDNATRLKDYLKHNMPSDS